MIKYACMLDGCNFVSDDEAAALRHYHEGLGHRLIQIESTDGEVFCLSEIEQSQIRDYDA